MDRKFTIIGDAVSSESPSSPKVGETKKSTVDGKEVTLVWTGSLWEVKK